MKSETHFDLFARQQLPVFMTNAAVSLERSIPAGETIRQTLFIQFEHPLHYQMDIDTPDEGIRSILASDKILTERYADLKTQSIHVIAALRWVGGASSQMLIIKGVSLTVVMPVTLQATPCEFQLAHALAEHEWLQASAVNDLNQQLSRQLRARPTSYAAKAFTLFSRPKPRLAESQQWLLDFRALVQANVKPVYKADKVYVGENSMNPAFENIEQLTCPLALNEKRIWLLRSDMVLALGVKNAYQEMWGYTGLSDVFEPDVYPYLDWNDRVGHPSLTQPSAGYDGGAYYAGHVAQRDGYLEVLNYSGRYDRHDLSLDQLQQLEAMIALQFQQAFGEQRVVFMTNARNNYEDYYELSLFYTDATLQHLSVPKREYTKETILSVLNESKPVLGCFQGFA